MHEQERPFDYPSGMSYTPCDVCGKSWDCQCVVATYRLALIVDVVVPLDQQYDETWAAGQVWQLVDRLDPADLQVYVDNLVEVC